ncbi:MAG TPA: indolepyruvate ferredoxin oxidoreductase subunit alpha [Candidatus Omnitrophota bacterium]|nr:indolepyruvate ferredoxin oxidoreductase subunit alpha [Candidatus Omnitrophota bacterium]HPS20783.1 indolepyruvate ferredoxin oxidoreductase subunit alpha [Candidatus Omnitrophota bacterium]
MDNSQDKIKSIRLLSGNEALAAGAYEAGVRVAAAYPGTPSSEILECIASEYREIDSQWSVNEKVAMEVALGASIGGVRALYASKHVGINVAMDPLMTAAYTGINGGFVVITCDDPGLHSSQNEQDNRLVAEFAKIPLIEPASPSEAKEFIKIAYDLSEKFDTPVLFRMTTRISHTKEDVLLGTRTEVAPKGHNIDPQKYVMVPANAYRKHAELEKKLEDLRGFAELTELNKTEYNDKKIGFITSGVMYYYAKEKYPDASFLKLGMSFPFPSEKVKEFVKEVKKVYVLEELEPFIENKIRALGLKCKYRDPSFRIGEIRPEHIPDIVKGKTKEEKKIVSRKPVLCPGCSHRPVFSVLKKLKCIVTGDIGCYTLAALPPLGALHTCVCMGGGITMFDGMKRAVGKNVVGVIGDSTFMHSGITGLINAVYNKQKGVILILDNSTTAMTGGQPHPGTGMTIKQEPTKKLDLVQVCKACGVDNVDVADPFDVQSLETLIKTRMEGDSLSVVIARFPCRVVSRIRHEAVSLISEKCKKCYACLNVGCPAIVKTETGEITINKQYCVGCGLCVKVCPFKALVQDEKK